MLEIISLISTCSGLVASIIKITQQCLEFADASKEIDLAHHIANRIEKDLHEVLRLLERPNIAAPFDTLRYVREAVHDVHSALHRVSNILPKSPHSENLRWFLKDKQQFHILLGWLHTVQSSLHNADRKLSDLPPLAASMPDEKSAQHRTGDGLGYRPHYIYNYFPVPVADLPDTDYMPRRYLM